jgi:hypothetical protein
MPSLSLTQKNFDAAVVHRIKPAPPAIVVLPLDTDQQFHVHAFAVVIDE